MQVLVTGAGGRIGSALLPVLQARGHRLRALTRRPPPVALAAAETIVEELGAGSDFPALLSGIDAVVHLADGFNAYERRPLLAHDEAAEARLATTRALAEAASRGGLHFVYLSTIKAMCGTWAPMVLSEATPPAPASLYGRLKLDAERFIAESCRQHGGSAVILRFPIVFGTARGDGNLERLLRLADTPCPLPFEGLEARRSLISAASLIDAAVRVVERRAPGAQTFLLHDGAISIEALTSVLRQALARERRLFRLPTALWRLAELLPSIGTAAMRFSRPLELDDRLFRASFDWRPAMPLDERLEAFARHRHEQ